MEVASRSRRFWAFVIDQLFITAGLVIIFFAIALSQADQIAHLINVFFSDPLWQQTDNLSAAEFNVRYAALISDPEVSTAMRALAYPFALFTLLGLLFEAAYYIVPTKRWGMTLGKKWVRIIVHSVETGLLPSWEQSTIRYFSFVGLGTFSGLVGLLDLLVNKSFAPSNVPVDILEMLLSQVAFVASVVAIVMIFARPDRRGLHDILAKTIVHSASKTTPKKPSA